MNGGNFEAEVVNSLRSINSAVSVLSVKYSDLERRGYSATKKVAQGFREVAGEAMLAEKKVLSVNQQIQRLGQTAGRMGGPMGGVLGRAAGGFGGGMKAGIGGAAFAGLAIAGQAIMANDRQNLEVIKQIVAMEERRLAISKEAAQTRKSQGVNAVQSQGEVMKKLLARGDMEAVDEANRIAKTGVTTLSDAQGGVAEAYTLTEMHHKEAVIEAASRVAATGEMGFGEAVSELVKNKGLRSRILATGGVNDVAKRLMVQARGQPMTPDNLNNADFNLARTLNSFGDFYGPGLYKTQSNLNQVDIEGQKRILSGEAEAGSQAMLAAAADPNSALLVQLAGEHNKNLRELTRLAKEQNTLVKWWLQGWANKAIGGARSAQEDLDQAHQTFAPDG